MLLFLLAEPIRSTVKLYLNTQSCFVNHAVVPHVTNAIMDWVEKVAQIPVNGVEEVPEVCVIEVRSL